VQGGKLLHKGVDQKNFPTTRGFFNPNHLILTAALGKEYFEAVGFKDSYKGLGRRRKRGRKPDFPRDKSFTTRMGEVAIKQGVPHGFKRNSPGWETLRKTRASIDPGGVGNYGKRRVGTPGRESKKGGTIVRGFFLNFQAQWFLKGKRREEFSKCVEGGTYGWGGGESVESD